MASDLNSACIIHMVKCTETFIVNIARHDGMSLFHMFSSRTEHIFVRLSAMEMNASASPTSNHNNLQLVRQPRQDRAL